MLNVKQSFLQRQISQLKVGGWPVFVRKVRSLARWLLFWIGIIAAAPIVLLIVVIRPVVLLRFGTMGYDRIGHLAGETEAYLCVRDREKSRRRTVVDVIGCPEPVCNRQLKVMVARTLPVTPGASLWSFLDRACELWTRSDVHHVKGIGVGACYIFFMGTEPHLSFTDEEHRRGQALLQELGIPSDASWVCIHNRDNAYLNKALRGYNWAYHDHRDFSVQTMVAAAEELSSRGYYVVRVGSIVKEALISPDPKIIDYANSPLRSDFMDIYLLAHGAFFLGNDSGLWCIPLIFRKPLLMVNFTELSNFFEKDYEPWVIILKHHWHTEKQRFLSLRELFETGVATSNGSSTFEKAGVELICNTPQEICDLAIELDERLKGQWQSQPGDEELQQRFWDIFRKHAPSDRQISRHVLIGASFLRNNIDLLD